SYCERSMFGAELVWGRPACRVSPGCRGCVGAGDRGDGGRGREPAGAGDAPGGGDSGRATVVPGRHADPVPARGEGGCGGVAGGRTGSTAPEGGCPGARAAGKHGLGARRTAFRVCPTGESQRGADGGEPWRPAATDSDTGRRRESAAHMGAG